MSSVAQLQAETIGRPRLLGLWILGKKYIHELELELYFFI